MSGQTNRKTECQTQTHPRLAVEWDRERNAPLMPEQVTCGAHRRVWWRCGKCNCWQASVASRAGGCG